MVLETKRPEAEVFMRVAEIDSKLAEAVKLYKDEQHEQVLVRLQELAGLAPASPLVAYYRAESLTILGRTTESVEALEAAQHRLKQMLTDAKALGPMLDGPQAERLARFVTIQESEVNALRASIDARLAEGLNKAELKNTVARLQEELEQLRSKAGSASDNENALKAQIEQLRAQEAEKNSALDGARQRLTDLQTTLEQRESAMQRAAGEQAEREKAYAEMESEFRALQEQANAAKDSERQLAAELQRMRDAGSEREASLNQARLQLQALDEKLQSREQAILAAQKRDEERDDIIAQMKEQLGALQSQAERAASSQEALRGELDSLRENERAKSEELDTARQEMEALKASLRERESAMQEAEERSRQQAGALQALQSELDTMRGQAVQAAASEQSLAAELLQLRENERAKAQALEQTRQQMENLRQELTQREAQMTKAMAEQSLTAEAKAQIEADLTSLRNQQTAAAQSEATLAGELDHLRQSESAKSSALDAARAELEALRSQVQSQEQHFAAAEQTRAEQQRMVEQLQEELSTIRTQARSASDSEASLADEVERLRLNEGEKTRSLEAARNEADMLRQALAEREKQIETAGGADPESLKRLQEELVELHAQAEAARRSESTLANEMESIRYKEKAKTDELKAARDKMKALEVSLEERERRAAEAERGRELSEAVINELKGELQALQRRTQDETMSSADLERELGKLRSQGGLKAEYLDKAHAELEALRSAVSQRDDALARSEHLLKRAREKKRPPYVAYALLAVFAALAGYLAYDRYIVAPPAPVAEVRLEFKFPDDYSIGNLYTRDANSGPDADWLPFKEAQGTVPINNTLAYHLQVNEERVENLVPLGNLDSRYLRSLWLPRIVLNDANLAALAKLEHLERLYIDDTATSRDVEQLEGLLPSTVVGTKAPESVMFVEATSPPQARSLAFPAEFSLGRVFVRDWTVNLDADWEYLAAAQGTVNIPQGKDAKLEVESDVAQDVSSLALLDPYALHTISLNGSNVNDEAMLHVGKLIGLRGLALKYTKVTNEGVYHLAPLKRLRWIEFYTLPVNDRGFEVIRNYPELQHLWIVGADIGNDSLDKLMAMTSLRRLHLANTKISDEGLISLNFEMKFCEVTPKPQLRGSS